MRSTSVPPIGPPSPKVMRLIETATGFVPQLGRALGFTAEDLAANHEGRLSERQILRLRLKALWYRLVAGAASLALTVVFAWGAFGLVGSGPMAALLDLGFAACAL